MSKKGDPDSDPDGNSSHSSLHWGKPRRLEGLGDSESDPSSSNSSNTDSLFKPSDVDSNNTKHTKKQKKLTKRK